MPKLLALSKNGMAFFKEKGKVYSVKVRTGIAKEIPAQVAASIICLNGYWVFERYFNNFDSMLSYVRLKLGELEQNGYFIP
jgi:hypothetical protein